MMRKKRSGRKRPITSATLQRGCASQCLIEELLPPELICHIFSLLPGEGMAAIAARACKRWFYCRPSSSPSSYSHRCQLSKTSVCANLTLLKWALQNGCPFDESLTAAAAARGNLKALQWLRQGEKGEQGPCPWNAQVCNEAARYGYWKVLRWALAKGCSLDKDRVLLLATKNGQLRTLQWLITVHMSDKQGQMRSCRMLLAE
ncbi:hypothetical protein QOT17_015386 [Balamuthia mandrillaris]